MHETINGERREVTVKALAEWIEGHDCSAEILPDGKSIKVGSRYFNTITRVDGIEYNVVRSVKAARALLGY